MAPGWLEATVGLENPLLLKALGWRVRCQDIQWQQRDQGTFCSWAFSNIYQLQSTIQAGPLSKPPGGMLTNTQ